MQNDECRMQNAGRRRSFCILHSSFSIRFSTRPPTTAASGAMSTRDLIDGERRRQDVFAGLPLSLYNEVTLHDPWGSPIVFMPRQHPLIGLAPIDKPFFFSAGPDRRFLTRDD